MRITFLPHHAYAMGGTVRTTTTLAETLAGRHQVEHVSVFRHREKPPLGRSPKVMGAATPIEAEWVKGSIAAVTSAHESFGMTIVEAMRCGLPVVSTDCPHDWRDRATALTATAGVLARGAVRRGRRKLGWVG
jgi:hypothetical protein